MECLLIPGIIGFVILALWGIEEGIHRIGHRKYESGNDDLEWAGLILVLILFVAILFCSVYYLASRSDVLKLEAYYTYVAQPNIISETTTYVVVGNSEAGLWQAGEMNLTTYNASLRTLRYWNSIPIIGSTVFNPPDYLKYVMVK